MDALIETAHKGASVDGRLLEFIRTRGGGRLRMRSTNGFYARKSGALKAKTPRTINRTAATHWAKAPSRLPEAAVCLNDEGKRQERGGGRALRGTLRSAMVLGVGTDDHIWALTTSVAGGPRELWWALGRISRRLSFSRSSFPFRRRQDSAPFQASAGAPPLRSFI